MRVKAVELVAYGVECDNSSCSRMEVLRNGESVPDRWFRVNIGRATGKVRRESGERWFCSKECFVNAVTWQLSHMLTETI